MYNQENCRFLKTHEWAFAEGENAVVGISDHAQEEISDIVFVDLPQVGREGKAGENCCVIESVKSARDKQGRASPKAPSGLGMILSMGSQHTWRPAVYV